MGEKSWTGELKWQWRSERAEDERINRRSFLAKSQRLKNCSRICFHFRKVLWLMCISWVLASAYLRETLRVKDWDDAREKIKEIECNEKDGEKTGIFLWTGQVPLTLSSSLNMKGKEETVKGLKTQEASACLCACVCARLCICTVHFVNDADSGDKLQTPIILYTHRCIHKHKHVC